MPSDLSALWRYPKLLADLLYGRSDERMIAAKMISFARTYSDTADFVKHIPGIVRAVFGASSGKRLTMAGERNLGMLASEAWGANTNWCERTGQVCEAAVLLWMMRLCCCQREDETGLDSSLYGMTKFALFGPRDPAVTTLLLRALDELLIAYSWQGLDFLDFLITYSTIAVVAGNQSCVPETIRKKVSGVRDLEALRYVMDPWWSSEQGTFSRFGHEQIEAHLGLATPKPVSVPSTELKEIRCQLGKHCAMIAERLGIDGGA